MGSEIGFISNPIVMLIIILLVIVLAFWGAATVSDLIVYLFNKIFKNNDDGKE